MAYSKQYDLKQEYKNLDRFQMSEEDIQAFISKADAYINATLATTYEVPFTAVPSTPPIIREISKDLALVNIFNRQYTQEKRNSSDWIARREERVEKLLKRLADADDPLSVVTSAGLIIEDRTDQNPIPSPTLDYKPTFDMRGDENWRIDPDRISDENDEDT